MSNLQLEYEQDYHHWIERHIALLKVKQFHDLDIDHLIEELEDMANRDRNELVSHLVILIGHLLKWQFQFAHFSQTWQHSGEYAAKSWQYTIIEQRYRVKDQLENILRLKRNLEESILKAYPKAVSLAIDETGLPKKTFPSSCPYSVEQLLNKTFYPK